MTIYIDIYHKWEDHYDQAVDRYDIKCPYFGFGRTYDFAECSECAVVMTCSSMGSWHKELCERLDSEECSAYCKERYLAMHKACEKQHSQSIPVSVLKKVKVKKRKSKRKMFQFADIK